jgi:L,D-peptidoglycan transpeptidase YkuD (ErfK/YbiS/YcfS/YnhG family)
MVIVPYIMIKTFLIILSFQILLFSSEQIILVVAEDMNATHASLQCYEDGKPHLSTLRVNLGTKGLAWGIGLKKLHPKELHAMKQEGDKKAPAGIFALTHLFGYEQTQNYKLPFLLATKELYCVDDTASKYYNKIINKPTQELNSFEIMKRDDMQYKLGIVVGHNPNGIAPFGSCIFMHVAKAKGATTAGCTSMEYEKLQEIASWLDAKKRPILIQIPKSSLEEVYLLYPELQRED